MSLRTAAAALVAVGLVGGLAAGPALAADHHHGRDWHRHDRDWNARYRRDHERREHYWRDHNRVYYGYGDQVYVEPPPVVYGPPPPPAGLNLLFSFH